MERKITVEGIKVYIDKMQAYSCRNLSQNFLNI